MRLFGYDPEPSKIRARLKDRDKSWSDDWVGIMIGTFNDERRGYEPMVNPLEVQTDFIKGDQAAGWRSHVSWGWEGPACVPSQ